MQSDMRYRLINLLNIAVGDSDLNDNELKIVADYLIANGVILPPFKIGDKVWYITGMHRTIIKSAIVDEIIINCNGVSDLFVTSDTGSFENSVDIFYPAKEEAEQKLKEMRIENDLQRLFSL